jgi:hypothetical protein
VFVRDAWFSITFCHSGYLAARKHQLFDDYTPALVGVTRITGDYFIYRFWICREGADPQEKRRKADRKQFLKAFFSLEVYLNLGKQETHPILCFAQNRIRNRFSVFSALT